MSFALDEDQRALAALTHGDVEGARILLESAAEAAKCATLVFEADHAGQG